METSRSWVLSTRLRSMIIRNIRAPGTIQATIAMDIPVTTNSQRSAIDRGRWPENHSANSAQKVWAAKFAARHPNVAVLDLSSFKCGHDAPIYGLIDRIISTSNTAYSALHDIDANKPAGSIKIRVKTYAYSLMLRREVLEELGNRRAELARRMERKKLELMQARQARIVAETGAADEALQSEIDFLLPALAEAEEANRNGGGADRAKADGATGDGAADDGANGNGATGNGADGAGHPTGEADASPRQAPAIDAGPVEQAGGQGADRKSNSGLSL